MAAAVHDIVRVLHPCLFPHPALNRFPWRLLAPWLPGLCPASERALRLAAGQPGGAGEPQEITCKKMVCLLTKQELRVVLMGCYEYVIPRR